jgi:hypothetical protein
VVTAVRHHRMMVMVGGGGAVTMPRPGSGRRCACGRSRWQRTVLQRSGTGRGGGHHERRRGGGGRRQRGRKQGRSFRFGAVGGDVGLRRLLGIPGIYRKSPSRNRHRAAPTTTTCGGGGGKQELLRRLLSLGLMSSLHPHVILVREANRSFSLLRVFCHAPRGGRNRNVRCRPGLFRTGQFQIRSPRRGLGGE